MTQVDLFQIWASPRCVWSQWAKPAPFAGLTSTQNVMAHLDPWPHFELREGKDTAVVVNMPREKSVAYGIALARLGWWPVPVFNCAIGASSVLNTTSLQDHLFRGGEELTRLTFPAEAPPAFLVDSKRMDPDALLKPGNFDNRYLIFPQDFPSAGFLKAHGIARVLLLQESTPATPREDLAHVLLRWQRAGLPILGMGVEDAGEPVSLQITRPSGFRSLFYRALAMAGLRRNSAGGFGAVIPQPSSG